jgi:hypothetical protein
MGDEGGGSAGMQRHLAVIFHWQLRGVNHLQPAGKVLTRCHLKRRARSALRSRRPSGPKTPIPNTIYCIT